MTARVPDSQRETSAVIHVPRAQHCVCVVCSHQSNTLNPHLSVRRESCFGLGPGYSALGSPAVVCEAAGGAAAVGERGLGCGLVQRKLEAFVLRLPKDTNIHSMWCVHSNTVHVLHSRVVDLIWSIITQAEIPVPLKGCLLKNTNSLCVPVFGCSPGAKSH